MVDAANLPNDQYGYSVYTLVAHADQHQVDQIAAIRDAINQTRAMIPAHVTVRGTFHSVENLDELSELLRTTAIAQSMARVEFGSADWNYLANKSGRTTARMFCSTTPALISLHDAFDSVIRPRTINAYPDEYRAHLTLCQDCSEEQIEHARTLVADMDIGTGFDIKSVQLMGRIGPAFGGEWVQIESFALGS
jgi:2'-5' RNA ligase